MERKEAQARVKERGGQTPEVDSKTLTYLVVGDGAEERKSSKLVKAERYIEQGYKVSIISEREFLKMM